MLMVILLITDLSADIPSASGIIILTEQILIYSSLLLTVISLVDYLVKNRGVLSEQKKDGDQI